MKKNMYKKQLGITIKTKPKISNKRKTQTKLVRDQTQSEAELQRKVVAKLRSYNGLFIIYNDPVSPALKYITNPQARMGFIQYSKNRGWEKGSSDLVIIWHGKPTFLELKFDTVKHKGKLSEEQINYRKRVEHFGYDWQCWRTMDDCVSWINKQLEEFEK